MSEKHLWGLYGINFFITPDVASLYIPVVKRVSDGKIFRANSSSWTLEDNFSKDVFEVTCDGEAEYLGIDKIQSINEKSIKIESGQMVAVIGKEYYENLNNLYKNNKNNPFYKFDWTEIQDEYKVCCVFRKDFEENFQRIVGKYAVEQNDEEISSSKGKYVTQRAKAAMHIFSTNSFVDCDSIIYRAALIARIENDRKWYDRIIACGAAELNKSVEELDRLVDIWFNRIVSSNRNK